MKDYAFLNSDTPADTVNPSPWRQAQPNPSARPVRRVPGVYQIRGFDLSTMTIIEGDTA
ncbi:MAG: hypothetical protein R3D69_13090 [Xanthobacteraceae bacterium]